MLPGSILLCSSDAVVQFVLPGFILRCGRAWLLWHVGADLLRRAAGLVDDSVGPDGPAAYRGRRGQSWQVDMFLRETFQV